MAGTKVNQFDNFGLLDLFELIRRCNLVTQAFITHRSIHFLALESLVIMHKKVLTQFNFIIQDYDVLCMYNNMKNVGLYTCIVLEIFL